MIRIAVGLCLLLFAAPASAEDDPFQPKAAERATIDKCLKRTADDDAMFKQAAQCIGLTIFASR